MSRINPGVIEELRRQAHDTLIDIRENIKDNRHWMVFPFNVYSSYIPDTKQDENLIMQNQVIMVVIHAYLIIWKVLLLNDKIV
ncbi:hypothetical protein SMH99_27040 [Spiroplasma poulsonii]|uniref:hypothetical protein n=1 Tax=Spiroplasma poulsonii TaxID=2138 RepID=UPI000D65CA38|nr:hypothetical protein [Spiroplasma poulsonii]PWF94118.1 hypothetical protein SMH99_27040 [Spiroplasma poulsonii]